MSDDGDGGSDQEPALAALEDYIVTGGTGNLLIDANADQVAELPVLTSIWECPMINKFAGFNNDGKSYAGWTCCWCPLENDGSQPKPF
jgi:hypothetical protein